MKTFPVRTRADEGHYERANDGGEMTKTIMKATFTKFKQGENWCSGVVGDYVFDAKSFDTGSSFGINGGRVSKLSIKRADTVGNGRDWFEGVAVSYDRGWDIEPTAEVMAEYEAVMELLENAPSRF